MSIRLSHHALRGSLAVALLLSLGCVSMGPSREQKADELIKKAEDNEGKGQGGGGGGGGGPPKGNQTPNGPAGQSTLPPGASRVGDMRGRKTAKAGEKWGDMRDKEREEVLQALKDKFPERFRELQKYYEIALAKQKRVTDTEEDTGADEE